MNRIYPCVEINLKNITYNIGLLIDLCNGAGIEPVIVTKSFCAEKAVVETIIREGIKTIADARIKKSYENKGFKLRKASSTHTYEK